MNKTERRGNTQKLLDRVRRIQNGTANIGWGVSDYSPLMNLGANSKTDSQHIIVVGHNFYRKVHTMFLESFTDGKYSLSVLTNRHTIGEYLVDRVGEEELIEALCKSLKVWFPEVRGGAKSNEQTST